MSMEHAPESKLTPTETPTAVDTHAEPMPYPESYDRMIEQATGEFIMEHFEDAASVTLADQKDDEGLKYYHQPGFDLVVGWEDGTSIAVDVSATHSEEREFRKMKHRRDLDPSLDFSGKRPVVDIHDPDGKVLKRKVPFAAVLYSPKSEQEWKKASGLWEKHGKKGKVIDWIEDQLAVKVDIIVNLSAAIQESARNFPAYREALKPAETLLQRKIAELQKEVEGRPGSHRDFHDMIRHRRLDEGTRHASASR